MPKHVTGIEDAQNGPVTDSAVKSVAGQPPLAHQLVLDTLASDYKGLHQSIAVRREDARRWIALIIILLLSFIVVASFASLWFRGTTSVDDIVKVISAIIGPVIGIVGAVTGFYFSETRDPDR